MLKRGDYDDIMKTEVRIMRGTISELNLFDVKTKYGLISGYDGNTYYFSEKSNLGAIQIDSFFTGDIVEFRVEETASKFDMAMDIVLVEQSINKKSVTYHKPGLSFKLDLDREAQIHLKEDMQEKEVIEKLAEVFAVTRIGHHDMGYNSRYEFCLFGVTETLSRYVRENGEFLVVFSCFPNESIQQKALNVEREIRKRRLIAERRPFINFYLMISNAEDLFSKVDAEKGKAHAAAIPFTISEILSCSDKTELEALIHKRFADYYYEVNLLGDNHIIEVDDLLFGERGKIADVITARCLSRNHSGIFGLRRSGKSSVLHGVTRRLEWAGIPYVLIESRDYETNTHWTDALYDIARKIRAKTKGIEQEETETRKDFDRRLQLNSTEEDYERHPVPSFVEDIKHYIGSELFVIAIDEIETITFNSATQGVWKSLTAYKGFWTALRDCGCPLVVCGVNPTINEESMLEYCGEECDNPMRGRIVNCTDSAQTYLPPFTDEQTGIMINTLGGYSNVGFSNVYAQINSAFGGQPWAIRQFCSYLYEHVKDKRDINHVYEVSKVTCDNYLRDFQSSEECNRMCRTILQHVQIYPEEYALLTRLALCPEKTSIITAKESTLIDHLLKYGLIDWDKGTELISFNVGVIRDYICKYSEKRPEDMSNDERRHYVQDRVYTLETKLKTYTLRLFRRIFKNEADACKVFINYDQDQYSSFRAQPGVVPSNCSLEDFFDHKKFVYFFSFTKNVILDQWEDAKDDFKAAKISKSKFISCMEDLNAGRSDADHYDAEDLNTAPRDWEIDLDTIQAFQSAYNTMSRFFESQGLM